MKILILIGLILVIFLPILCIYAAADYDPDEKHIPKKPLMGEDIDGNEYFLCPNCCQIVAVGEYKLHHCSDCGQVIDWSDIK